MNLFGKRQFIGLLNFNEMKKIKLLTLILLFSMTLIAQNNSMTANLGYSNFLNKKATGFSIGFDYQRKVTSKHFLGLGLNYTMTERRGILPNNLDKENIIIRDFTYIPDSVPNAFWTKESFSKFCLASKPDKYFNVNASINYNYTAWENARQSLKIGIGVVLTFNDEQELTELLRVSNLKSPLYDLSNFQIAVFQYNTYIDLEFIPQIKYNYQLNERMKIGIDSRFYCYTKTNRYVAVLSPTLSFQF